MLREADSACNLVGPFADGVTESGGRTGMLVGVIWLSDMLRLSEWAKFQDPLIVVNGEIDYAVECMRICGGRRATAN